MHIQSPGRAALVGVAALSIVVAACSTGTKAAGGSGGDSISIASPASGAEVAIPFEVQLESNVPIGEPDTGNHHVHLYFDTGTDSGDYDIVYGTTAQVSRPLSPGTHTIIAALANADHSLAGPTQTITVTVTEGGAGGGGSSAPPPSTPGSDY